MIVSRILFDEFLQHTDRRPDLWTGSAVEDLHDGSTVEFQSIPFALQGVVYACTLESCLEAFEIPKDPDPVLRRCKRGVDTPERNEIVELILGKPPVEAA